LDILPLQQVDDKNVSISYQNRSRDLSKTKDGADPEKTDRVMLVRDRLSRIYYLRKFFDYPISLSWRTMRNLGIIRLVRISVSYLLSQLSPIRKENSLEDFFINRFGRELYKTFFKDYTEKVWGVPCSEIKPEWGAQRIKGLSVSKAILHGLNSIIKPNKEVRQKNTETSLIDKFLYPKFGPGHLWEEVSRLVIRRGGELIFNSEAVEFELGEGKIISVICHDNKSGKTVQFNPDYIFSSMPVKELIEGFNGDVPDNVREVASGLVYRDFIAVGILLKKMNPRKTGEGTNRVPDTWIYIQERDVKVGRIQVFNNWSPYLVAEDDTVWLGMEYFCDFGDELWSMIDDDLVKLGLEELEKIGLAEKSDFIDGTVVRMPKTYPAYFGSYDRFNEIRDFTDKIDNLFLVGRNGMHKYNNQDHSMLTAMKAVDAILAGETSKNAIWDVNTEEEYHEERNN
jgi:protoporphyrinogen oxidase